MPLSVYVGLIVSVATPLAEYIPGRILYILVPLYVDVPFL